MRLGVGVSRRQTFIAWPRQIGQAAQNCHRLGLARPVVSWRQVDRMRRILRVVDAVAHPIMDHELEPCGREDVEL